MAKDIWSGNEHFLRDQEKPGIKTVKIKTSHAKLIIGILTIAIIIFIWNGPEEAVITGEVVLEEPETFIENLDEYRDLSAAELLNKLNVEKGFKPDYPLHEVDMIAGMYFFEPREVYVNMNETVRLRIKSIDIDHAITIPAFLKQSDLPGGEYTTIEFVPLKTGTFVFYNKKHEGMEGRIIVEE